jgi:KISS1 receptor
MNFSMNQTTIDFAPLNKDLFVDVNRKYNLHIIMPTLFSLIIFFAIIGNGTIIYLILKRRLFKKDDSACTNCYIINLAISDLCFILSCAPPTMAAYMVNGWIFGKFLCQIMNFLMFVS